MTPQLHRNNPVHLAVATVVIVTNLLLSFIILVKLRTSPETVRVEMSAQLLELKLSVTEVSEIQRSMQSELDSQELRIQKGLKNLESLNHKLFPENLP